MNTKKIITLLIIILISLSIFTGCVRKDITVEEPELLISAAASMTDVLKEIAEAYSSVESSVKLTFTFGGSGALQSQIEEGAPVDVFVSAALKQMDSLDERGYLLDDTRKDLLVNKVVLITPSDSTLEINSFEDLTNDEVKTIALGDPSGVPVGQYSEEIFMNLNILDNIKEKSIFGNDVRSVLTWVESGEVDCGVVYATDAYSSDKVTIVAEAPKGSHKEVTYPVAIIKSSKNVDMAKQFLEYLSSEEAAIIFKKHGFNMK